MSDPGYGPKGDLGWMDRFAKGESAVSLLTEAEARLIKWEMSFPQGPGVTADVVTALQVRLGEAEGQWALAAKDAAKFALEAADLQARLSEAEAECARRVTIEWHNEQVQEFIDAQDQLVVERDDYRATVVDLQARLSEAKGSAAQRLREIGNYQDRLAAAEVALDIARNLLKKREEENERLKGGPGYEQIAIAAARMNDDLQARLFTVEGERDEAHAHWLAWCDRGELAESELKRTREELEEAKGGHEMAAESVVRLRKEAVALHTRLSAAEEDAEAWRWLCDNLPEDFDGDGALEALIVDAVARLSAAEGKLDEWEADYEALSEKGYAQFQQLKRAEEVVKAARLAAETWRDEILARAVRQYEEGR